VSPHLDLRRVAPELNLRRSARDLLTERLDLATRHWRLSPRMAETLLLVVLGLSNKEIAACRARSEVTIEAHVTALLRRAGVDSRGRLVTKFWLGLGPLDEAT
jgi:DNA-binding NarL/FixJ family response regulator